MNIFFTLTFGLLAIHIWEKWESKLSAVIGIILLGLTTEALHTDYGMYGVAMMLAFYIFRDSKIKTIISQVGVYILFNASETLYAISKFPGAEIKLRYFIQGLSLLALIIIFSYNSKKGKNLKYFFYAFYPVHLLIIGLIKIFR